MPGLFKRMFRRKSSKNLNVTDKYMDNIGELAHRPGTDNLSSKKLSKKEKRALKKDKKNKGSTPHSFDTVSRPPVPQDSRNTRNANPDVSNAISPPHTHPDDVIRKPPFNVISNNSSMAESRGQYLSKSSDSRSNSNSNSNSQEYTDSSGTRTSGSGTTSGSNQYSSQSYTDSYGSSLEKDNSDEHSLNKSPNSHDRDGPANNFSATHFQADFSSFPEENNENVPNGNTFTPQHLSQKQDSPGNHLNYEQVQKLEAQLSNQNVSQFSKSQPKSQLTRLANGQLVPLSKMQDLSSPMSASSEFALSTDDEDNDYNQLRRKNNLNMAPMLEPSPTSTDEEEESIGLNPIMKGNKHMRTINAQGQGQVNTPQSLTPSHEGIRRNTSYMSNSESDTDGPDAGPVGPNRSFHYFSDSETELNIGPKDAECEPSPLSQSASPSNGKGTKGVGPSSSKNSKKPSEKFTFDNALGESKDKIGDMRPSQSSASEMMSVGSGDKSQNTHLSPRTFAIQQAQKLTLQGKISSDLYPDVIDSAFDPKVGDLPPRKTRLQDDEESDSIPNGKSARINNNSGAVIANFAEFENNVFSNKNYEAPRNTSKSVANEVSPVSKLLKEAKARRNNRNGSSVNSAPVTNTSFLRQHHNLQSKQDSPTNARTPRQDSSSARLSNKNDHSSSDAPSAAKEKLIRRRRQKEAYLKSLNNDSDTESDKGIDANESWLIDEVTGALGPRHIAADLESLGERSGISIGNKSNRSSRSRRSHRSASSKSRKKRSDESVGSRHSRHSRASRYSVKSAKSNVSEMSEQSRSVANDLHRLEMQLVMLGSRTSGEGSVQREGQSITGESSTGRPQQQAMRQNSRTTALTKRVKVTVVAPAGKLGIILANKTDARGTVISGVRTNSVLKDSISPGDRIIAIDGEDVSRMTVSEITAIMARKNDFERVLTVLAIANDTNGKRQGPPAPDRN